MDARPARLPTSVVEKMIAVTVKNLTVQNLLFEGRVGCPPPLNRVWWDSVNPIP